MKFLTALKIQLKTGSAFILSFLIVGILRWGYYPFLDRLSSYSPYVIIGALIGLVIASFIQMYSKRLE